MNDEHDFGGVLGVSSLSDQAWVPMPHSCSSLSLSWRISPVPATEAKAMSWLKPRFTSARSASRAASPSPGTMK